MTIISEDEHAIKTVRKVLTSNPETRDGVLFNIDPTSITIESSELACVEGFSLLLSLDFNGKVIMNIENKQPIDEI